MFVRNYKISSILMMLTIGAALAFIFSRLAVELVIASPLYQSPKTKSKEIKEYRDSSKDIAPIAEFDAPSPVDLKQKEYRNAKGEKYNKGAGIYETPLEMNEKGEAVEFQVKPKSSHWANTIPGVPVSESSLILVGRILDAQAYISGDKTAVYSEFKIEVEVTYKADTTQRLYEIVADRPGGVVRFPSGREQRIYAYSGQRMPQRGHRYILFLRRSIVKDDPTILVGFELKDGMIVSLDDIPPFNSEDGMDEKEFLMLLQSKIEKEHQSKEKEEN